MIFETHAHYDDEAFDDDRDSLLKSLYSEGIEYVVNVGASITTTVKTLELMKQYPFVYGAVGVHPSETAELNEENFKWLGETALLPKVVAIGEIGLDYYWDTPERSIQKEWFSRQMELAKELKLPAIIHSRDAAADTLDMIQSADLKQTGGVIHCFSYGKEMAKSYLDMGFYLGIGGVVTFKNAKKLKEVVEYAPMEQLVLETDCPYLAPEPNRGKRNSSLNLIYVAQEIAKLKGISCEEVITITENNAKKMYGFPRFE
ncbi:YchF/TatD family DNA exonuclease [Anaerocolumna sedimenticola]|uniref:YchF/TatD family DNA exonuclease n=1 Tax=Anaerocolumna sedimenticola TaxID=2696063 RepID=A0A6P1TJS7_9FIRM|nr:TatD family hydrolase [Anaerocolumna sedimenticola]QHQ60352.1 YchF/TatD family DNA exonuclease [Anaerocolumna sedimenticola]